MWDPKQQEEDKKEVPADVQSVLVPCSIFHEILLFTLGPILNNKIERVETKNSLPLKISCPMHPFVHSVVFGTQEARKFETSEEIHAVLGKWSTNKTFSRGSYAVIRPPLVASYDMRRGKSRLQVNYEVYSHVGVLLWPLQYEN